MRGDDSSAVSWVNRRRSAQNRRAGLLMRLLGRHEIANGCCHIAKHTSALESSPLLSHWRFFAALSVGSSAGGTLRTSAPLLALSTGPMLFLISSNRQSWGIRLGHLQIPGRPSFGSCSGRAVLALVRPVVPDTLALSVALSAGGVSGSSALQQRSRVRPVASQAPTAG